MVKAKKPLGNKTVSPYTLLNRWMFDGNYTSPIPSELTKSCGMPQTMMLYHFISSPYLVHINKEYNKFGLWEMKLSDVFKFLKHTVKLSGFRPPFTQMYKNKLATKVYTILKLKFPFLKQDEIYLLIDKIDESPHKKDIYEGFGLYKPTKRKSTEQDKKDVKQSVLKPKVEEVIVDEENEDDIDNISLDSLMENFS